MFALTANTVRSGTKVLETSFFKRINKVSETMTDVYRGRQFSPGQNRITRKGKPRRKWLSPAAGGLKPLCGLRMEFCCAKLRLVSSILHSPEGVSNRCAV
jgi:hypothetical protein